MIANFARSMPLILQYEGSFSDNAADPGGATMEGVTLSTYQAYVGRPASVDELKNLQPTRRDAIYRANFWQAVQGDQLPSGVDLISFDAAIQHGPSRAVKFLQMAVGAVVDGEIGPATLRAIEATEPTRTISAISASRGVFYREQPAFATFGKGWLARLSSATATASAWAVEPVGA